MSILHSRIADQPGIEPSAGFHPVGTADTPMVMPMSELTYADNVATYGTLHPLVMADGATVPARSPGHGAGSYAEVVPAGRP
jgi:hypothetical protein